MSLEELTDVYQDWAAECGYKTMSADELLTELLFAEPVNVADVQWLKGFLKQWAAAEKEYVEDMIWERHALDGWDAEDIYDTPGIRQSIEEDRK
jgi:hypothetical protein